MSEPAKKSASIKVFNSFSSAEMWVKSCQPTQHTNPELLPEFGEELDTTPLQKVVSRLERGMLGSVYLTESAPLSHPSDQVSSLITATPSLSQESVFDTLTQADFDMEETIEHTIHRQNWELWASQSSLNRSAPDDRGEQEEEIANDIEDAALDTELIFKVREMRVAQWNQILHPKAQFSPLHMVEELTILTPEIYLEDTLTLSDHHGSVSNLNEQVDQEVSKLHQNSSDPSITHQHSPHLPSTQIDQDNQSSTAQRNYLVGYAKAPYRRLPLKNLSQLHPYSLIKPQPSASTSLVSQSGDQTHTPDVSSKPVKTLPISKIKQVIYSMRPMFDLVAKIHKADYCLGGFDPSLFKEVDLEIHADEDPTLAPQIRPLYPLRLYKTVDPSTQSITDLKTDDVARPHLQLASNPFVRGEELSVYLGYSPPEMYGYYHGVPSKQSDVFSAAMMLYYALTDCPRFAETMRPFARLPSPIVYRQDLPPELVSVVYRAISPSPSRRPQDMKGFLEEIEWALHTAELREQISPSSLQLEAGHEIHIGLLKGQYNPINQDDLFLGYQSETDLGLFVVTDGVSICEHGSGDLASGLVREEAAKCWRKICQMQSIGDEDDTLSELNLNAHDGQSHNYGRVLTSLVNHANRRIGDYINERVPVFHGPPEGIMAATIVAAAITRGVVMLTSVGDSRIYLIREGHITSLMYDEDLYTHLLQARQSPAQAQQSPSAAALVHCVGEFSKDVEQRLQASPITPQLREVKLLPGDQLVLCSDGVPDYAGVDEEDAEDCILKCVENALTVHHAAFELISLANRGGGGDNLSCIVLKFSEGKDFLRGER